MVSGGGWVGLPDQPRPERVPLSDTVMAPKGSQALRTFREGLAEKAHRALEGHMDALDRTAAFADARDDEFPGFAPSTEEDA